MPEVTGTIHWPWRSFFDGALAFVARYLQPQQKLQGEMLQTLPLEAFLDLKTTKRGSVLVELPSEIAFGEAIDVYTKHHFDARRILEQEIDQIDPLSAGASVRLGGRVDQATKRVPLLCIKKPDLEAIEQKARSLKLRAVKLASADAPNIVLDLPATQNANHTARKTWGFALCMVALSIWGFTASINHRLERQTEQLISLEAALRNDLAARRSEERAVGAMQRLADLDIDRMTVGARLERLAKLNTATPEESRWLSVEMAGQSVRLTCVGQSAADARESLASAFPDARVQFVQAITSETGDLQGFMIELDWSG